MNALASSGIVPYRQAKDGIEFLVVQHSHGHWEFPKGKIDPGETEIQAALRELTEEAGVVAELCDGFREIISYSFFDRPTSSRVYKTVYFFVGHVVGGQLRISHEHLDAKWLPYEQALQRLTHRESKKLLEKAYRFLQNNI